MPRPLFSQMPPTIFDEMSGLAREHGAINLGQGFPDGPGPAAVLAKAADALLHGYNQYPPSRGLPELRRAVADHYNRTQALDLDWEEVTVTSGATEALAAAILALLQPGDEALLIQPLYDAYAPLVRLAGAEPRFVTLRPPEWRIEREALERAITPQTRVVIMNNPVNPTGRVLDDGELAAIAEVCIAHDLVAVCDEVWEQVVFDSRPHRPLIGVPGMRERAVKIGSAGKMFGLTGWKVGWLCAAPKLALPIARAHQFLTFTTAPNLQVAAASGLAEAGSWFHEMPKSYGRSRDRLARALVDRGFRVLPSEGTYFLTVDLAASGVEAGDRDFCLRAVREHGVAAIPVSAFFEHGAPRSIIRLCFAKQDEVLDAGAERLAQAARALKL